MVFELVQDIRTIDGELLLLAVWTQEPNIFCDLLDDTGKSSGTEILSAQILFLGDCLF
jgi:hypothetical protein